MVKFEYPETFFFSKVFYFVKNIQRKVNKHYVIVASKVILFQSNTFFYILASNFFLLSLSIGLSFLWVGRQLQDCKMGLRIHFVVDPHGWCCMGLIVFVWLYNIVIIPKIVLFPHYEEGHIPGILIISKFLGLYFFI